MKTRTTIILVAAIVAFSTAGILALRKRQEPAKERARLPMAANETDVGALQGKLKAGRNTHSRDAVEAGAPDLNAALALEKKRDYRGAREALLRAAEKGNAAALFRLGMYAERGYVDDPSFAQAREYYSKAIQAGFVDGYAAIARMLMSGVVTSPNDELAMEYLEKGVAAGSTEAFLLKGTRLLDLDKTSQEGLRLVMKAAEAENPNAMLAIARMYRDGRGMPVDIDKAVEWARMAANSDGPDNTTAKVELAMLLLIGQKIENSVRSPAVEEAIRYLTEARDAGSAEASKMISAFAMASATKGHTAMSEVRAAAVESFERGNAESAMAVAVSYLKEGNSAGAMEWVDAAAKAQDWRGSYAKWLMDNGTANVSDAVTAALSATVEDYQRAKLEKLPPSKSGTIAPRPISTPPPAFPASLASTSTDGAVTAHFFVNEQGQATNISILSSTGPAFSAAAVEAIAKWKFAPGTRDGRAVVTSVAVPISFKATP